jgi:effector-binding domain-containing protein
MSAMHNALALLQAVVEQREGLAMYEVSVKDVPEQPVLRVRKQTTMEEIGSSMGAAFDELMAFMGPQGIQPAGPPVCVYSGDFDGEHGGEMWICMPVGAGVEGQGAVEAVTLPPATMATTVHKGPYDSLSQAYAAVFGWIQEHGHTPAGSMRDVYLTDPDQVPPEEYLTEVQWPIA